MRKKRAAKPSLILPDDQESLDQRDAFRYVFPAGLRLTATFKGKTVEILDISAGGLAFKNLGFKRYEADRMILGLKIPNYTGNQTLAAWTRILHITSSRICHCIFENCRVQDYEMIHKYVLEMQKRDLKIRAANRKPPLP